MLAVRIASFIYLAAIGFALSSCSGDDGVATPRTTSDAGMNQPDVGDDVAVLPTPAPKPVRILCGGTNIGDYASANLDQHCAQQTTLISLVTFFECSGCSTPLECTECEASPQRYAELNLREWDDDLSGQTLTQENAYLYICRIAGACEESTEFAVKIDKHIVGECVSGSYLWKLPNTQTEQTGTFDAGGFGPPTTEVQNACR